MKQILLYLTLWLSLSGFSAPQCLVIRHPTIDAEFKDYVDDFLYRADGLLSKRSIKDLTVRFEKLSYSTSGDIIGMCHWSLYGGGPLLIEIDQTYWAESNAISRWAVLFHEMGHCVCNRMHVENQAHWIAKFLTKLGVRHLRTDRLPDGCPSSLMIPSIPPSICLEWHQKYYIKELFNSCVPAVL